MIVHFYPTQTSLILRSVSSLNEWHDYYPNQGQVPCPTEESSGVCRIKLPSLGRHIPVRGIEPAIS